MSKVLSEEEFKSVLAEVIEVKRSPSNISHLRHHDFSAAVNEINDY